MKKTDPVDLGHLLDVSLWSDLFVHLLQSPGISTTFHSKERVQVK